MTSAFIPFCLSSSLLDFLPFGLVFFILFALSISSFLTYPFPALVIPSLLVEFPLDHSAGTKPRFFTKSNARRNLSKLPISAAIETAVTVSIPLKQTRRSTLCFIALDAVTIGHDVVRTGAQDEQSGDRESKEDFLHFFAFQ